VARVPIRRPRAEVAAGITDAPSLEEVIERLGGRTLMERLRVERELKQNETDARLLQTLSARLGACHLAIVGISARSLLRRSLRCGA
jgi:hypothetical protein